MTQMVAFVLAGLGIGVIIASTFVANENPLFGLYLLALGVVLCKAAI